MLNPALQQKVRDLCGDGDVVGFVKSLAHGMMLSNIRNLSNMEHESDFLDAWDWLLEGDRTSPALKLSKCIDILELDINIQYMKERMVKKHFSFLVECLHTGGDFSKSKLSPAATKEAHRLIEITQKATSS